MDLLLAIRGLRSSSGRPGKAAGPQRSFGRGLAVAMPLALLFWLLLAIVPW